jgi:NitT/TauT family transport system substrate-binding protein
VLDKQPRAVHTLLAGWFKAIDYLGRNPADAARRMGVRQQTSGEQFQAALQGLHIPTRDENIALIGGANPGLVSSGRRLMTLMLESKLLRAGLDIEAVLAPAPLSSLPP